MTAKVNLNNAFEELEKIVAEFESGEIDLEKSLDKFKRGVLLSKQIKIRLAELENDIEEIKADVKLDDVDAERDLDKETQEEAKDDLPF